MNEVAPIGHNSPPAETEAIQSYLVEITTEESDKITKILGGVDRMPKTIESEEDANKAVAFIKQMREHAKNLDNTRTAVKKPYLEAGRTVDAFFKKNFTEPLERARKTVDSRLTPWVQAKQREAEEKARKEREAREEEARKAAEEAARLADEGKTFAADEAKLKADEKAQEAVKAGQVPKGPAVRSDLGATASTSMTVDFDVEDYNAIPPAVLWPYLKHDHIDTAIRAYLKDGGRKLSGVRIYEKARLNVR